MEELREIVAGVLYAGGDEGVFLYWECEVKEGRTPEQALAAMHEAFSGQELADCLLLYHEFKAKLPTLPESEKPTLRLRRTEGEGSLSGEENAMDPNATLIEIRRLLSRGRLEDLAPTDSHRLVELVEGLDQWLASGGILPRRWEERHIVKLPAVRGPHQPWWQVRPSELAWRYGCDADRLRDGIDPEHLSEWQFDLVMGAIAFAEERMARMRVPEE